MKLTLGPLKIYLLSMREYSLLFLIWGKHEKIFTIQRRGNAFTRFLNRFEFRDGISFSYGGDWDGWTVLKIGGHPQEPYRINSPYDCTGEIFCSWVDVHLFGFITVGHYCRDV